MAANSINLPAGFVLDNEQDTSSLPEGFSIDQEGVEQQEPKSETPFGQLSGPTELSNAPTPLEFATGKAINTTKNIINEGLFGIPARVHPSLAPQGLSPREKFESGLLGGEVIGSAVINTAFKSFQKLYNLPVVKNNQFMQKAVDRIKKIIKPKAIAKTKKQLEMSDDKVADAMNAIQKNKETLQYVDDAGRLPTNLDEAITAASQTKTNMREQYVSLQKAAGESTSVDLTDIAEELRNTYKTRLSGKTAKKYALSEADRLDEIAAMNLGDIEQEIIKYNEELTPFYNKTITGRSDVSKAGVDARIANLLRKKSDEVVTATTGTSQQPFKNTYGALAEFEEQLVKQFDRLARKPKAPGVSAFDTVPIIYGAFTGNVPLVTAGIGQRILSQGVKGLRDPNKITGSAFKLLDQLNQPTLLQQAINVPLKGAAVSAVRSASEER